MNSWSEETFIKRAKSIGENICQLITQVLLTCKHPEQGFKRCEGILQLAGKYPSHQVEQAALLCIQYDYITYHKVKYLFENYEKLFLSETQSHVESPVTNHENIRGEKYFS